MFEGGVYNILAYHIHFPVVDFIEIKNKLTFIFQFTVFSYDCCLPFMDFCEICNFKYAMNALGVIYRPESGLILSLWVFFFFFRE